MWISVLIELIMVVLVSKFFVMNVLSRSKILPFVALGHIIKMGLPSLVLKFLPLELIHYYCTLSSFGQKQLQLCFGLLRC